MLRKDLPIRVNLADGISTAGVSTITVYANPIIAAMRSNLGGTPGETVPPVYPNFSLNGLALLVDGGDGTSYPGTGSTWFDLINNYNGSIVGANYQASREFDFSGTDQYIDFGDDFNFNNIIAGANKAFTLAAWVKFDDLSTNRAIVSKLGDSNHGENNRQLLLVVREIGGIPRFELLVYYGLGGSSPGYGYRSYHVSDLIVQTGVYYNIVATYDGTQSEANRFNFYVDGQLRAKQLGLTLGGQGFIQNGAGRLALGASIGSSSANNPVGELDGQLAHFTLYNRVITATEVYDNYFALKSRY